MRSSNICNIIIETATVKTEDYDVQIVNSGSERRVVAEVVLQEADEVNRNGRFYSKRELFPATGAPRIRELLETGELRSENGHPLDQDLRRQAVIDPTNTVAIIKKLWTEGSFIKAHVRGTNNAAGDEFDQDLRDGFKPAWSLRALGRVEQTPRGAEVKDIKIITWDRVIFPSHPRAYTQGIVSESSGIVVPNNDPGMVIPIVTKDVEEYIKQESVNFQRIVETFELYYDKISLTPDQKRVSLTSKQGDIFIINLESYVEREIRNFCLNNTKLG